MTNAFRSLGAQHLDGTMARIRSQAAMVRSLLDELDRIVPASSAGPREIVPFDLRAQLAEELSRLGCRLLECAATVTKALPSPPVTHIA